ncbi:MAG: helix-turn-helix transcriptional regulator [Crocinitomicaceae bacterium]|nr:helix-turn-helix transcriptional regulator [Crocinitomicaceae bacterium]
MRSKVAERIMSEAPKDVEIFVRLYADIVVRINQILEDKGMSQKELAEGLNKSQSEISKWLNGDHNFTLRSLAKIQAELGEELFYIPKNVKFGHSIHGGTEMTVYKSSPIGANEASKFNNFTVKQNNQFAHVS